MPAAGENGTKDLDAIIVGLGNPGEKYRWNRHNAGFIAIESLARQAAGTWTTMGLSRICSAEICGRPVLLAKSLTYMNHCGKAVQALLSALSKSAEDLLLIYDDLDLPLGRIRIRRKGSAGGHHGLESILAGLQTEEILRIRLGIGEENMPEDKIDFVLSDFPPGKQAEVEEMIIKAGNAVQSILSNGVSKSMTLFNA